MVVRESCPLTDRLLLRSLGKAPGVVVGQLDGGTGFTEWGRWCRWCWSVPHLRSRGMDVHVMPHGQGGEPVFLLPWVGE
jgi:hypothetical protein